jgi:hypothetical protein
VPAGAGIPVGQHKSQFRPEHAAAKLADAELFAPGKRQASTGLPGFRLRIPAIVR